MSISTTANPTAAVSPNSKHHSRTVRVVCISDTHNLTPPVPPGDILLHAGDLTNQGSYTELHKQLLWLSTLPHEYKVLISGNHDAVTLDRDFHAEYHSCFKSPSPESPERNINLIHSFREKGFVYLCDEEIELTLKDGRKIRIYGSPWTLKGRNPYGYQLRDEQHAEEVWSRIPMGLDILLTHTPPHYMLDTQRCRGCDALRSALERKRPRAHVFGHVHAGHGVMRVKWEEQNERVSSAIKAVCELIEDPKPERNTIYKVDLRGLVGGKESCLVNAAMKEKGSKAVVLDLMVLESGINGL